MSGSPAAGAAGAGATARRIWRYRVPSPRAAETDASVRGQAVSEAAGGAAASPPGPAAGAALDPDTDWLAEELPLTLFVNGQEMLTTLCSPSLLEELVLGLLFDEGLISSLAEVHSLRVDRRKGAAYAQIAEPAAQLATRLAGRRLLTSGCGQRSPFYAVGDASLPVLQWQGTVLAEPLLAVLRSWQTGQSLWHLTGGVHGAALATPAGRILVQAEDIGRHNAVDKISGLCLRRGWEPPGQAGPVLLVTGRISSEMVRKVAHARIPVVVSRSAATSLAVDLAEALGVTLAGFARGGRMNIYSHPERMGVAGSG